MQIKSKSDYLFEVSWEVCNKVGGIYTVIRSKAMQMADKFQNYMLIGPYIASKAKIETKQLIPDPSLKQVFSELEQEGIIVYYGEWRIEGSPKVFLIDFSKIVDKKNELKGWLWDNYKIDSLYSGWDFDEQVIWTYAISRLLLKLETLFSGKKISAQFHEWMAGLALLHLKKHNSRIGTVFTTHATMLGRAMCGSGMDLYHMLDHINPENEAKRLGVMDKFTTERACANTCDAFTTVSEITGLEAEKILGKKPDVYTLNGLDIAKFPTFEETSIMHRKNRDILREFLSYYFYPYYNIDLKENIIFYTVARYEFRNKGLDIFVKALGRLNQRLRDSGSKKTVTAMFFIPNQVYGIKSEILQSKEIYEHMSHHVEENLNEIKDKIVRDIIENDNITKSIFSDSFIQDMQRIKMTLQREGNPPLCTHYIYNEGGDQILNAFKENGLNNSKEDKVKVISYPVYVNSSDGLINLNYYDLLTAGHLGVYPSYYEPWGYTPLESASLGVPSLTTDLSGFGMFIDKKMKQEKISEGGIFVLTRLNKSEEQVIEEFASTLLNFVQLIQPQRVEQKILAKRLATYSDWKDFVYYYVEAHNLAIDKVSK